MNPDTGHLVNVQRWQESEEELKEQGYEEVPKRLQRAARKKLKGRDEAHVSLTSGGQLSNWAKKRRRNRRRNKIAKASRRANRK